MNWAYALNTAWMWKGRRQSRAFQGAMRNVEQTQADVLADIVTCNQVTDFGKKHRFSEIKTSEEYQDHLPLSTYDMYAEDIERIALGESNVLTRENVRLLEPTSGTTGGEKLIPYTASLARQFQCALATWITDLMRHRPAVRCGRAYWSVSPALGKPRESTGGIPIGFDDDTAYLGLLERWVAGNLLVAPPEVARMNDIENFRYVTLLHLVAAEDLALISIWSPTFLSAIFGAFEPWAERICYDLRHGTLSLPNMHGDDARRIRSLVKVARSATVRSILRINESLCDRMRRLWPRLAMISCWADAAAARYVGQIQNLFPTVEIQSKGLIATEACVSIPLVGRAGSALALTSHFFEFADVTSHGHETSAREQWVLAHQLSVGNHYKVAVTTAGGLYRYQLHDIVEVVGFDNECPLLRFVGKVDRVSDLVGEKLSEPHVRAVLERVFAENEIIPDFSVIVPIDAHPPRYCLYVQIRGQDFLRVSASSLAASVQTGLEENPYYRHAVRLRQLSALDVQILSASGKPAWLVYEEGCLARGQKAGDIKPSALDCRSNWIEDFSSLETIASSGEVVA